MNLPNKLTIIRVALIPVFVAILLIPAIPYNDHIAMTVFIIASLTDMLDGKIARKYNLVTNFGKLMDPLADKLLVCSALVCLVQLGRIPTWMVLIIIAREFAISGTRSVAADKGVVIAASYWGKFKTVFQIIAVCMLIANLQYRFYIILTQIMLWVAIILTAVSLVDYIIKNIDVLKD